MFQFGVRLFRFAEAPYEKPLKSRTAQGSATRRKIKAEKGGSVKVVALRDSRGHGDQVIQGGGEQTC